MTRISIDLARRLGTVDRRIFGQFIEHLGRCIYGGVYDEGSPLSDGRGFRRDVLDAARPLRIPILRWPGGNFVSGYHWLDGVGPRDRRPRRSELAWYAEESNRFGTDEFIEYCHVLGTEPFICMNMGSGTMDEAQAWVEYCNGTGNTSWANLRRQHGHAEPYRVRYWGLGNEMYGGWQIGNMNAHDYVKKARAFAMVMKRTDPSIQLIGCGQNGWSEWDEITLSGLAELVDFHSIHLYTGGPDHYATVFQSHQAARALRAADRTSHPYRVRRVERLVADAQPRGPRGRGGGALQPLRRAGRRNLPERLHPPLPHGAHRQLRPARQRDRADRHQSPGAFLASDLPPAAALCGTRAGRRPRRARRGRDLRADAGPGVAERPRAQRRRPRAVHAGRRERDLRRGRARGGRRAGQPRS